MRSEKILCEWSKVEKTNRGNDQVLSSFTVIYRYFLIPSSTENNLIYLSLN